MGKAGAGGSNPGTKYDFVSYLTAECGGNNVFKDHLSPGNDQSSRMSFFRKGEKFKFKFFLNLIFCQNFCIRHYWAFGKVGFCLSGFVSICAFVFAAIECRYVCKSSTFSFLLKARFPLPNLR